MTEAEWLACGDPEPMLDHLQGRASERKLRLYLCAWAFDLWHRMQDERSRQAVLTAERFADGLATRSELLLAFNAAQDAWREVPVAFGGRHGKHAKTQKGSRAAKAAAGAARTAANPALDVRAARRAAWQVKQARKVTLASVLRDQFGNPFRPVAITPSWLVWGDGAVVKLATAIYDEGRFEELPVLADALEEAGCSEEGILGHLRGPGPHVRGCHVVDLLLSRE
jgi:hypothetical protein